MTRRVLLRLAFDGTGYHGTQRQEEAPTVHGELLDVLSDAELLPSEPKLRAHGRLDAGVSARDHPVALTVEASLDTVARTVAGSAQGILPWAGARVHPSCDPRASARSRTYRYYEPCVPEDRARRMESAWSMFEGRHDFSEFARVDAERGQDPIRVVESTRSWRKREGLVLEAKAPSFLRHQVRRMVGTCRTIAREELDRERVEAALQGGHLGTHEVADAGGLVLHRVGLTAPWRSLDEAYAVGSQRLGKRLGRARQRCFTLTEVLGSGEG